MNVLTLNCGSSSVKFQLIETDLELITQDADRRLASGIVERIGSHGVITLRAEGKSPVKLDAALRDHRAALDLILRWIVSPDSGIESIQSPADIHALGHRIVHGGEKFRRSVRITPEVIAQIEDCIDLAPLHNPANLKGIRAGLEIFGEGVPQVAVFDTAFHTTMPEVAYLYGIPYQLYRRHKLRRYGFHGTSHRYVAYRYRKIHQIPDEQVHIITLHLGNGCSACAIRGGQSIATSMGFTPLEGLLMGTRSGDIDPSLVEYLEHKEGLSVNEILVMLNKHSGLLGISGLTSDMRELIQEELENDDRRARLAIDMFCHRARAYIGRYFVELGGADAVVFTGGIGENSPLIRERICKGLECIGLRLDAARNEQIVGEEGLITTDDSRLKAVVIPTNEELLIARDTVRVI
ncbi:MAG TPA: acetate kinase, partial [Acidobacteriota bacterium]|nr:acetate kinase [Acidobacteriota bacterium]